MTKPHLGLPTSRDEAYLLVIRHFRANVKSDSTLRKLADTLVHEPGSEGVMQGEWLNDAVGEVGLALLETLTKLEQDVKRTMTEEGDTGE